MMFPEKFSMSSLYHYQLAVVVIEQLCLMINVLNSIALTVMTVILFGDVKVVEKQQDHIPALHVTSRDLKQND